MDKLAQEFADLAAKYGPSVAEAAKGAAVVEGYSTLVSGLICLAIAGILSGLVYWLYHKWRAERWDEIVWLPIGLGGIAALILIACAACQLFDPWTWVSIYHPELWLAKRAFHI